MRNGQRIPALAETSKQGLVYILDRRTGKPIFGMQEFKVPQSDVPGRRQPLDDTAGSGQAEGLSRQSFQAERTGEVHSRTTRRPART